MDLRQCETTFGGRLELRNLLSSDVWPHAGRSSFVLLLEDKAVSTGGVALEKAVGMRLTFRHPPPLKCFSDQFLIYLNSLLWSANSAYQTWAGMSRKSGELAAAGALPLRRGEHESAVTPWATEPRLSRSGTLKVWGCC